MHYGVIHVAVSRVEQLAYNTEIDGQAVQILGIDDDILAPDRLHIHPPSALWNWKDYHCRYVELLVENGLA